MLGLAMGGRTFFVGVDEGDTGAAVSAIAVSGTAAGTAAAVVEGEFVRDTGVGAAAAGSSSSFPSRLSCAFTGPALERSGRFAVCG